MELWQILILFGLSILSSILSGISGAGGGFIMTPVLIGLGLTPAQAVSTGKIGGLMVTIGSLGGLRKSKERVAVRKIVAVMLLAFVVGLFSPYAIKTLDNEIYRIALGIIILFMIPFIMIKKIGIKSYTPSTSKKIIGGILLTGAITLQGIFSGGLGTLVNIVLMGMLGMNATEANITKRWSQLILNLTIIIGVITSGLIVWQIAAIMLPANLSGSYLGAHIAVKKGNKLVMNVMVFIMILSAIYLIFG